MEISINYTISRSKYEKNYILWRETQTEHGFGCRNIFRGKKTECEEERKKILKEKRNAKTNERKNFRLYE